MKTRPLLLFSFLFLLSGVGQFALIVFYAGDVSRQKQYLSISRQTGESRGLRGRIYDRNGAILAYSLPTYTRFFDWAKLDESRRKTLQKILERIHHPILGRAGLTVAPLEVELVGYEGKIVAERTPELDWVRKENRFYPYGGKGGALVGLWRESGSIGGIELFLNPFLEGKTSRTVYSRRSFGIPVPGAEKLDLNLNGWDVVLTVDQNLQELLGNALREAAEQSHAKAAAGILLDVSTGEILAVEHFPFFHPQELNSYPPDLPFNPMPLSYVYEPGSTFKPITMAIALSLNKVDPMEKMVCHGPRQVADTYVKEFREYHGAVSWEDILIVSCNVGASIIGQRIEEGEWKTWLKNFGFSSFALQEYTDPFFSPVVRNILFEDRISLPPQYTDVDRSRFGFGQGISVTLLRLVKAYTVFAWRGEMIHPCIVKEIHNSEGNVLWKCGVKKTSVIRNPSVADSILKALRKVVVSPGGTGKRAHIPGYVIAGKTGTAQIYEPHTGNYSHQRLVVSFIGFLDFLADEGKPVPRFRYILGIYLVEPEFSPELSGGMYVAPVFQKFAGELFWYSTIAPDEEGRPHGENFETSD
ncbi:MAG: peptidoglycan D,D-transpeptidase FtsI family protein [bacterium JZ-2024 1]